MNKRDIIMQIRSAKAAHIRWKSYAQIAIRGIVTNTSQSTVPLVQTESEFGKWYYGDGMTLSMLRSYNALEEPNEMVHETYMQIYTLQKAKLKGGFFSSRNQMLKRRQQEIDNLILTLSDYSKILIEGLNQLEIEVLKLTDEEIDKMVNFS